MIIKWTKYNNPNKRKPIRKKMDRSDADIIASKQMFDDRQRGIEMPMKYYDEMSDKLCGQPSREGS